MSTIQLHAVTCPSTSLCAFTDDGGHVFTATNPTGDANAWTRVLAEPDSNGLNSISCPSVTLCLATDTGGNVITSTNPTGGAGAWKEKLISDVSVNAIACPTSTLCAAGDENGNVFTSANPGAANPTWASARVDQWDGLHAVSCPSAALCVAGDEYGNVITSTTPAAGAGAWTTAAVDPARAILGFSCASVSLCVAVDATGSLLSSTNPTGGVNAWHLVKPSLSALTAVSCPTDGLCVAADAAGGVLWSTSPTGSAGAWTRVAVDAGNIIDAISCASSALCVAVDRNGNVITTTDPTGPAAAWTVTNVAGGDFLFGIACPTVSLCVAADWTANPGKLLVSTDPTAGAGAWHATTLPATQSLYSVACSTAAWCVTTDGYGHVASSADPAGGADAWKTTTADTDTLYAVSCGSPALCVAVDLHGFGVIGTPAPAVPAALTPPSITGQTRVGATLNTLHGTWTNDPGTYAEQWLRCDSTGAACTPITGATGLAYTVIAEDAGRTLRVRETATNDTGSGEPSTSTATAVVIAAPVNVSPPVIDGIAQEGQALTAVPGSWTADPVRRDRAWLRCDLTGAGCVPIDGATGAAYVLTGADVGSTIRVREVAGNAAGDGAPVTSASTGVVTAASSAVQHDPGPPVPPVIKQPGPPPAPSSAQIRALLAGTVPGAGAARIAAIVKRGFRATFAAPEAGRLRITWTLRTHGPRPKTIVVASASRSYAAAGNAAVTIKVTAAGRRELRHVKRVKLAVTAAFTPAGASTVTFTKAITLRR